MDQAAIGAASGSSYFQHAGSLMEQSPAVAALALDFIQQLPAQQSETAAPFSGVLSEHIKLFQPEIEKFQGQIASHSSGDFIVVFRKPFNAALCAIALHRMFAALSQALPELERIQLRMGIHAETSPADVAQAQQRLIDRAHELKEVAPGGRIFVSPAFASTIDGTVDLKPAGEHKLAATAEPLTIFELISPPIKPLQTARKSHLSRLRLPLAAALALAIIWTQLPFERVHQQLQFLFRFLESSATPKAPKSEKTDKVATPSPARKSAELRATIHPPNATPPHRREPLQVGTANQPQIRATEVRVIQLPPAPQSNRIAPEQQASPGKSSSTAAYSIPKPRPRPPDHPLLAIHQAEATAPPADSSRPALSLIAESTEGPISIIPKTPTEQNANLAAAPKGCEFLRQAFDSGTLVPSVDRAAYQRFLKCRHEKLYSNREGADPAGAAVADRQSDNGGAANGGDSGSGGDGGSSGKSNGRGNGKGK